MREMSGVKIREKLTKWSFSKKYIGHSFAIFHKSNRVEFELGQKGKVEEGVSSYPRNFTDEFLELG